MLSPNPETKRLWIQFLQAKERSGSGLTALDEILKPILAERDALLQTLTDPKNG